MKLSVQNLAKGVLLGTLLAISSESFAFRKTPTTDTTVTAITDSISTDLLGYVPTVHPQIVKERLACMNTTIKMTYNLSLLKIIEYYTVKQRDYTQTIMERSSFYFPIFEDALRRHNMPDELKYLSIVESALQPKVASWAAAVGLWQFIPATGKEYGLQQDWYIDERMDIYKSTDAACRYLKFLYNYHGDWQLALAAYNCGPGRVDWAVKRAGGKNADFWTIYNYLPQETRGYVPAFIAVCYAMHHSKDHLLIAKNPEKPIPSDTILVSQFLNVEEFAKQIQVSKEDIEKLNPHLKKNAVPAYQKNYPVRFPAHKREYVNANRQAILNASRFASQRQLYYNAGTDNETSSTEGKQKMYHTVALGESLGLIALKYGVTVTNLRVWNQMANDWIYPNQQLAVWVKNLPATTTKQNIQINTNNTATVNTPQKTTQLPATQAKTTSAKGYRYHTIRKGDNLWDIAVKNKVTVEQLKQWNNLYGNYMLKPGQQIVIGTN
jgi:membrane-bound lytic murein transglycosylase D